MYRAYFPNGLLRQETDSIRTVREVTNTGDFTHHIYSLQFTYDLDGRRTQLKHPSQLVQTATYDHASYGYDALTGALDTVTDVMGQQFRYHYNARGDLDSLYMPHGILEQFVYDADGNRTRDIMTDVNGWGLFSDIHGMARDESSTYDAHGKRTWSGNSSFTADTVTASYTGIGQTGTTLLSVRGTNGDGSDFRYTTTEQFTNDALGNLVYNSSDLSKQNLSSTNTWSRLAYYNGVGNNSSVYNDNYQGYQHGTGRLLSKQGSGVSTVDVSKYDSAGNTLMTYSTNRNSTSTLTDRVSYYAADGSLFTVEYRTVVDQANLRMKRVFEEYRYDALGRRIFQQTRRGCSIIDTGYGGECRESFVRRTVWDGSAELYEIQMPDDSNLTTAAGVPVRENDIDSIAPRPRPTGFGWDPNPMFGRVAYAYGLGVDQPLSVTRFRYSDQPTDMATWMPYPTFSIVPYWNSRGEVYDVAFTQQNQQCVATGHCADFNFPLVWQAYGDYSKIPLYFHGSLLVGKLDKTGTYYRRNRTYDPVTGRFTQEDPIGLAGGLNAYGFANGDPVNYSDPFGLCGQKNEPPCIHEQPLVDESWNLFNTVMAATGVGGLVKGVGSRLLGTAVASEAGTVVAREVAGAAGKTLIPEGEAVLVAVKDGTLVKQTTDVMMSHARLVEKAFGSATLPEGGWVGTVGKVAGKITTLNSKTVIGNQGAAPAAIQELMKTLFH